MLLSASSVAEVFNMSSSNGDIKRKRQPQRKSGSKRRRHPAPSKPFGTLFKSVIVIGILLAFAIGGAGIGAYIAIIKNTPDLGLVAIQPNAYTSIIYDSKGNEIDRLHGDENREYVTLENIPQYMQDAVIAIEDERFYQHDGVDARGFARAVFSTVTGKSLQGGSTITQQLIKNNVTKVTHNSPVTKLQEQYLATKYEKELTKQLGSKEAAKKYILELYLNTIALGHGYNGVQAASLGYFNKDASQLDLAECASLAGVTNNPSLYSPRTQPENNKSRQSIILKYMLDQGYITQEEKDAADAEDIYSKISAADSMDVEEEQEDTDNIHSYFVDAMFEQISTDLQNKYNMSRTQAEYILYNGGLQINSTIDVDMQNIVDEVFLNPNSFPSMTYNYDISYRVSIEDTTTGQQTHTEYKQFARSMDSAQQWVAEKRTAIEAGLTENQKIAADKAVYNIQPQAAMVIIDYQTGEVKALAGGRDKKLVNRGFNRATDSARQPGSVFKVLAAYAPAIDTGKITAASLIKDEPYTIGDYSPNNWWGKSYRGNCTARTGIRDSMNILAVKTMVETGLDVCYDYLLNFGFTTLEDDNHAATALGGLTNGVTQLEVAAAYGTIANLGEYKRPMFYSMVLDHDGNVLLENNSEPRQVLKATSAYVLTQMMSSVVNDPKGTGTAAKFKSSSMPVVGKTGTTTNTKDLTFVGYTPYYVGSIWFGYDRYDTTVPNMDRYLSNQHCHLDVWRTVMERVHQNLEVKEFPQPDGISEVKICKTTGMLPNKGCETMVEYFAEGTEPKKYCSGHGSSNSDDEDGESDNESGSENAESENSEGSDNESGGESSEGGNNAEEPVTEASGNAAQGEAAPQEQTSAPAAESEPEPAPTPEPAQSDDVIVEPTVSAG